MLRLTTQNPFAIFTILSILLTTTTTTTTHLVLTEGHLMIFSPFFALTAAVLAAVAPPPSVYQMKHVILSGKPENDNEPCSVKGG